MKKFLILMILIFGLGVSSVFGQTITINNATLSNNNSAYSYIPAGHTAKVNFTYTASDCPTPLFIAGVSVWSNKEESGNNITTITSFSSDFPTSNESNFPVTLTFTMPTLSGNAIDDTHFYVRIAIVASGFAAFTAANTNEVSYIDNTLPVELSAFDAVATAEDFVNISWTVQSETNISGYFIIRGLQNNIETAQMIPAFINATNSTQEHSYSFTDKEVTPNNIYFYWLQSVEFSLQTELFGPIMVKVGDPTGGEAVPLTLGTQLIGNYPNPFNPSTSVSFSVATPSEVSIDIYNVKGQLVKNLYDSFVPSNRVNQRIDVLWNGKDNNGQAVASGVYYTKMIAGKHTEFKKMLLMK